MVTQFSSAIEGFYALRRLRPLSRRLLRTDRPALVDILNLNPCLRERLRLLGWNVRFVDMSTSWLRFETTLFVGLSILSRSVNFHQLWPFMALEIAVEIRQFNRVDNSFCVERHFSVSFSSQY